MKRLIIAVTAFMIGWYICGFFALQALDYLFPFFLFFNGWIENILWPVYLHDIFTDIGFLVLCLGGAGIILPFEHYFTIGTVITHNRNRYHRYCRKRKPDEMAIKKFIRLMSILTICIFVASIISNALYCVGLGTCFSCLSFVSLGTIYGAIFVQKLYGKRH